MTKTKH